MEKQQDISARNSKTQQLKEKIAQYEIEKQECSEKLATNEKIISRRWKLEQNGHSAFKATLILGVIVFLLYMCDVFHWAGAVAVAVALLLGLTFKIMERGVLRYIVNEYGSWSDACQTGRDLKKELKDFEKKQARLQREIDLLEGNPDALKVYRGKDWNMRKFKATPAKVKEMELDLENLFVAAYYIAGDGKMVDNWMCRGRRRRYNAIQDGKYTVKNEYDAGVLQLANSGSWKLQLGQAAMLTLDEALMNPGFDMVAIEYFDNLCQRLNIRRPETEEEKKFFDSARMAAMLMGGALQRFVNLFGNDYKL